VAGRDAVLRVARSITRTGVLGRDRPGTPSTPPGRGSPHFTAPQRTTRSPLTPAPRSAGCGIRCTEWPWSPKLLADLRRDVPAQRGAGMVPAGRHHRTHRCCRRTRPRARTPHLRAAARLTEADVVAMATTARLAKASAYAPHEARSGRLPTISALVPRAPGRVVPPDPEEHGIAKARTTCSATCVDPSPHPATRAILTAPADTSQAVLPDDVRVGWITALARVHRELGRLRALGVGGARSTVVDAQLIARFTCDARPKAAAEHAAVTARSSLRFSPRPSSLRCVGGAGRLPTGSTMPHHRGLSRTGALI
jgi:hypothetical protein